MRFSRYEANGVTGLALEENGTLRGKALSNLPTGGLEGALAAGELDGLGAILNDAPEIDRNEIKFLPPLPHPGKIICVGLNYSDHTSESRYEQPDYPTLFNRFDTSLVGHDQPLVRPSFSNSFDYEGEMVAVIGTGGRTISKDDALKHVAGYSVFNDGSVREYQFRSPQWTVGKTFDDTGGFGPAFVTADELPSGGSGLLLQTRLNGEVVQSATTADMIFSVADCIHIISEAITLEPGDIIVTGTPAGIGWAREPKLLMQHGDVCEVEIEGIGLLRNSIVEV